MENNITATDNGKTAAIVSYITIIRWLIAYFGMHKDKRTDFASYHLRQTLLFAIVSILLGWGLGFILGILIVITGITSLAYIATIVQIGLFVVWLIGLLGAIKGEKKPIPLIGEKAQSMFPGI